MGLHELKVTWTREGRCRGAARDPDVPGPEPTLRRKLVVRFLPLTLGSAREPVWVGQPFSRAVGLGQEPACTGCGWVTPLPRGMTTSQAAELVLKALTVCWGQLDTNMWNPLAVFLFLEERVKLIFN